MRNGMGCDGAPQLNNNENNNDNDNNSNNNENRQQTADDSKGDSNNEYCHSRPIFTPFAPLASADGCAARSCANE